MIVTVCAAVWLIQKSRVPEGTAMARIELSGKVIREIDLSAVAEPFEFTVEAENGSNTVRVEKGRIAVTEADCPDKVCVKTGYIENRAMPIVCLPHRLVITVNGNDSEYDAVAGDK